MLHAHRSCRTRRRTSKAWTIGVPPISKKCRSKRPTSPDAALQFGKVHGPFGQKAYIAYVKLVPLSAQQVADLQADRARKDTRVVQATIDGISYFWSNEYRTKEHILELVEPYRYSDVGRVLWAVNYGDVTNYPAKAGTFWAKERTVPIAAATNSYIAGEKAAGDSLRSLVGQGHHPRGGCRRACARDGAEVRRHVSPGHDRDHSVDARQRNELSSQRIRSSAW